MGIVCVLAFLALDVPAQTVGAGADKPGPQPAARPVVAEGAESEYSNRESVGADSNDASRPEVIEETGAAATRTNRRTELNLLGQTDAAAGESRRNENVKLILIDNNALQDLNIRLGPTATIVEEFKPAQNYFSAEYGNSPSVSLHAALGTSQGIHGRAYWRHQNSVVTARSFFQVGDVQPARENEYGFTFGLPVWEGGYLSLEGNQQKIRGSVNGNVLVPRPDERTSLTNDPELRAMVEMFLAAYPNELPNRTDINERALNTNAPQVINNDTGGVRLDQLIGPKDQIALRYLFASQSVDAFQLVAGLTPDTETRAHTASITWTRQWTQSSATDFSVGFGRVGTMLTTEENWRGNPKVATSGLTGIGPVWFIPVDRAQNRFRYAGQFRQIRGRHSWSAGFELARQQINGWESDAHRGEILFSHDFGRDAITNLRMGEASILYISLGDVHRGYRNWDMQYFAGDNWRATSDLTLNFGLRYRPITRPYEVDRRDVMPYSSDLNNLAPYFGFAYRLPGFWGVLRASFGLHYGEIYPATFQQNRFNPPGNAELLIPTPDLLDPLGSVSEENLRAVPYLLSPDLATPYSQQYNFRWELQPARFVTLQLGYVGSRSPKLFQMWRTNRARPVPGIDQTTETINQRRPNPDFATIYKILNASRGYYDAAKATLMLRSWNGLTMDVSYWFSKAMDLGATYSSTAAYYDTIPAGPSEYDVHNELKARSNFDQPHAFSWQATYELPAPAGGGGLLGPLLKDWKVFAVTLLKSGTPFSVGSGGDSPGYGNVDGTSGDRPHLLDPSVLGRTIGHPDTSAELLPRSAFRFMEPTEARGNLGRNVFRKGPIRNVNLAFSRTWAVASDKLMTFRAESINFFNTPQFASPGYNLAGGDFGEITNTLNDGRTFRFLLSFGF